MPQKKWELLKVKLMRQNVSFEFLEMLQNAGVDCMHRSSYDKKTIAGSQLGYLSEISIAIYSRKNWLSGNRFSKTAPFKGSRTHGLFLGERPGERKQNLAKSSERKQNQNFVFMKS